MEQKSYDKHPENKDSRDDSIVRDNLCRYQGPIFPYTCVCVCVYVRAEEILESGVKNSLPLEAPY